MSGGVVPISFLVYTPGSGVILLKIYTWNELCELILRLLRTLTQLFFSANLYIVVRHSSERSDRCLLTDIEPSKLSSLICGHPAGRGTALLLQALRQVGNFSNSSRWPVFPTSSLSCPLDTSRWELFHIPRFMRIHISRDELEAHYIMEEVGLSIYSPSPSFPSMYIHHVVRIVYS